MVTRALSIVLLLALTGCAVAPRSGGLIGNALGKLFGRHAAAEAKAIEQAAEIEQDVVTAAQVEAVKTQAALQAARVEHPESRPVEVAQRTNEQAVQLLGQRATLTLEQHREALAIVEGLLSSQQAAREAAEARQAATEGDNAQLADQLAALRAEATALARKRAEEAARNLELANQLRIATVWKWAATGGTALLGVVAIAYRLNLGRFQSGAAEAIAALRARHGDAVAGTARGALDAILHRGDQTQVARLVATITPPPTA